MSKKIVFISILVLSLLGCREKRDFVEDRQGVLSPVERDRLVRFHRILLRELDIHLKLVVLDERPGDLDALAAEMFAEQGVGRKTGDARGVLILVDPAGRQVRMEVGYGLEGVFPDAFVGHIERNQMVPFFQANRVGPGIEATVELLVAKALESVEERAYDPEESRDPAGDHLSGGAGARVDVATGSGQGWMLDFASMQRFVGFNHRNQWHFKDLEHPYMFAFHEWRFDAKGFPHPKD